MPTLRRLAASRTARELSGPYELGEMCRDGWSEIETETSPANAVVTLATWPIYTPQSVTVKCAAGTPRRQGRVVFPSPSAH